MNLEDDSWTVKIETMMKPVGTKNEKTPLVLLHGWGKQSEDYQELIKLIELNKKYKVYAPDLPGFGDELVEKPMDLAGYARWLEDYLQKGKIHKAILVGHSFGGRVAIKLAVREPELVSKLVLIDAGGIERKTKLIKLIELIKFIKLDTGLGKIGGREIWRRIFGSGDYLRATPLMRETLKKVVAENLESELPEVGAPTLIIWGKDDHTTPLWQGELMHRLIKNSELVVIDGDHGIPYRKAKEVAVVILEYLERDTRFRTQDTGKETE